MIMILMMLILMFVVIDRHTTLNTIAIINSWSNFEKLLTVIVDNSHADIS